MSPVTPQPRLAARRTSILWRSMRQFSLLAVFAVVLFWGAAGVAARPLPPALFSVFALLGVLVFVLALILAYFLARGLTDPLRILSRRVTKLNPDQWGFERSAFSGDEVELLDRVIADMAHRLQRSYEEMEQEIRARTRELKEQYLKDRTILTSIHHGVVVTDRDGTVTDANPAAVTMMGAERSESLCGKNVQDVLKFSHHQQSIEAAAHPVERCLTTSKEVRPLPNEQMSLERPDHLRVPVMIVVSPLLNGSELLGAIAVFHDVTEERRLDYMKSEFISLASHQLRTPLSSISWYLELLKTDDTEALTETQKAYVEEMTAASQRMVNLIDALLHVSKIEGGGIQPDFQPVDLSALVRAVAEDTRPVAKERKISLETSVPDGVTVATDPTLVQIVLHNMLSNAVKYSEAGGAIIVALSVSPSAATVTVEDTGVGIPLDEQKYLFTRLFRASNATKSDTTGSGLGLYISRIIAEQLKGRISFVSTEGKGASFTLELPLDTWKKPGGDATKASS